MTTIGTSLQQGMAVLAKLIGSPSFTWNGTAVECVPASLNDANSVIVGGMQDDVQLRLLVKAQDWLSADSSIVVIDDSLAVLQDDRPRPLIGKTLTYKGRLYRIILVKQDPSMAYFSIQLGSPRK